MFLKKAVGIDEVYCNLKPKDKLNHVENISTNSGEGGLNMVGEGINDDPALAASTIGIVLVQRASGSAIEVPFCIAKSHQTTSLVKQNIAITLNLHILSLSTISSWFSSFAVDGKP